MHLARRSPLHLGRLQHAHPPARQLPAGPRPRLPARARRARQLGVGPGPPRHLSSTTAPSTSRHARRVQGARRAVQRQLPLRRRRAALPARRRGGDARSSTTRASRRRSPRIRAELPQLRRCCCRSPTSPASRCCPARSTTRTALAPSSPTRARPSTWSPDDLYILYTGGTTGMPKGVLWRQEDIFFAALGGQPPGGARVHRRSRRWSRWPRTAALRALPGAAVHARRRALDRVQRLHQGGTVVDPDARPNGSTPTTSGRPSSASASTSSPSSATPSRVRCSISSSARTTTSPTFASSLSGGAILTPALKEALPRASSRTSDDHRRLRRLGDRRPGLSRSPLPGSKALTGQLPHERGHARPQRRPHAVRSRRAAAESGWLARAGHVPLGYYSDAEKTAQTFPVIGGVALRRARRPRHASAADGTIVVLGRGSVCINTGGEKIYPEEVEQALKHHPAVYDAVVVGTPNERLGQQVTAVVQLRAGATAARRGADRVRRRHTRALQAAEGDRLRRRGGAQPERQGRLPLGEGARARSAGTVPPDPIRIPFPLRTGDSDDFRSAGNRTRRLASSWERSHPKPPDSPCGTHGMQLASRN